MSRHRSDPRVFVISDIHTDFDENMSWCESLSDEAFLNDALILGGDVSDDLAVLETTLRLFARKFKHVFFTPGNHDLWIKRKTGDGGGETDPCSVGGETVEKDSLDKLETVLRLCETCGVHTKPTLLSGTRDVIEDAVESVNAVPGSNRSGRSSAGTSTRRDGTGTAVWIVPVLAWHHASFDTEPDIPEEIKNVPPPEKVMRDFRLCSWPEPLRATDESVAEALDALNDTRQGWGLFLEKLKSGTATERNAKILSFSHFLPRLELCPEKRMLFYPNLPKAVGSDFILRRIRGLGAFGTEAGSERESDAPLPSPREHVHVFGHTHFGWDQTIDNVRYVQAAVSYPHEWKQRPDSLRVGPDSRGVAFDLSTDVSVNGIRDDVADAPSPSPLCVWDDVRSETRQSSGIPESRTFGFVAEMRARWSDHYKANPREPENVELAWWVNGGRKQDE